MEEEAKEHNISSKPSSQPSSITLQKAVDMGEYSPDYLANFPEWHTFSKHIQFEFIRKALENRNRQLVVQWAEIVNVLDFSKKPHLKEALHNIEKQLQKLKEDKEKLYTEYSVG